jgi:hypothetical protein
MPFPGPRSSRVGSGCDTKHLIAIYSKDQGIGSHSNRDGDILLAAQVMLCCGDMLLRLLGLLC